jgi:hypothetical protein
MTRVTGGHRAGHRAGREEAEVMLDRVIVRPIPQGNGVVWLIEPVEKTPGGAAEARSESLPGRDGAAERDEAIRALREQVAFLQAEVQDRKRELRAEQEARRREVAALHELLAMTGARDPRRGDQGVQALVPPPAPPDGAAPAPGPGGGEAPAPAESWWRRVLGRRGELP